MSLKFYYDLMSQPSRAIYVFLKVTGIKFESKPTILGKLGHKSEEFLKINPIGQVPVIDDNGFIVRESVGILRYLCREKGIPDHWYPKESKAQAKLDEFIEWQHIGLRLPCAFYFKLKWLEPRLTGEKPLESEIERFQPLMLDSCDLMETFWLNHNKKFLFGNHLTIADLLAVMELEQPKLCGFDPRQGRPRLAAYMASVKSETSPYYDEANKIIDKLASMSKL
ncbi:unnamed protein product [Nezara viridula]|uniref:Uncharacterized protein n=1 Tax=Nezara viridula TaxID=85310 RepID=A0A9P0MYL0_NEZVI|nr:unnamed protein product [Nezara viridula]